MRPPPRKCDSPGYFFKFIPPAGLKSQLEIPKLFRKYIKNNLNNKTAILRRGCLEWRVKTDGCAFGEGWEIFMKENNVQDYDFLIFKHEGDMVFDTMVFDTTCCEREYPTNQVKIIKEEEACSEEENIGKCEMESEASKKILKRKRAFIGKSRKSLLKSKKTMISHHDNHSSLHGTLTASCEYKLYLPLEFTTSNGLKDGEIILKNGQTQKSWTASIILCAGKSYCIGRGWHGFCVANGLKYQDHFKLEIVRAGIKPIANVHRLSDETPNRKTATAMVETEDLISGLPDETPNRYFDGTLKQYRGSRKTLHVPKDFELANRLKYGEIILRNEENEGSWIAMINRSGKAVVIQSGLHEFCVANGLSKGMDLRVEIIQNGKNPVATISRVPKETRKVKAVQNPSFKSTVASIPSVPKETPKLIAVQNPYFKSTITASCIKESFVNIPMDFARLNGLLNINMNGEMFVTDEQGTLWPTNLCIKRDRVRIRQFREIWDANGLKEGDEFLLELAPNNKMPLMKLHSMKTGRQLK